MESGNELALRALARVSRRLIPFLFVLYMFAYLDRVNVGYAALFIRRELHFSDTVYGTGAGLFFLSYALFEVPSNLILLRVGPRRWIGALMVVWGVISASMPLAHTPGEVLFPALFAGCGGGRIFSRHRALFHLLVSAAAQRRARWRDSWRRQRLRES